MGLTGTELLSDAPALLGIGLKIEAAVAALPPAGQRRAVDFAKAAGFGPGTPGYEAFAMIDSVEDGIAALPAKADRKALDYAKLAGLQPGTPVYDTFALVDTIIEQGAS